MELQNIQDRKKTNILLLLVKGKRRKLLLVKGKRRKLSSVLPDAKGPKATTMEKATEAASLTLEHPTGILSLLEAASSSSSIVVPPKDKPAVDAIPEVEISHLSTIVVGGEEYVYMHDLEKAFSLRMDEGFALFYCHGKAGLDTTTSHAEDNLLLPLGDSVVDTIQMAQAEVALAEQAKVPEEEFLSIQALIPAPPASAIATPSTVDPKRKLSINLYSHLDDDKEDHKQEDVLDVAAWALRSGEKRKAFGQGVALAHYLGTLSAEEVVIVHGDYSPNGCYNLFALQALYKILCLSTLAQSANMVVLVKRYLATSVFGVNFRGCVLAHVAMNQVVGVFDSLEITSSLLNREPPQAVKRKKIVVKKLLKQKPKKL